MTEATATNHETKSAAEALLEVNDLTTYYETESGEADVKAVDGVSFSLDAKETIGLVGESGCGKSTVGMSLLRALPPQGHIVDGAINFNGRDITSLGKSEVKELQWDQISMIYQGAMDAFNPVKTIGYQIREALAKHDVVPESERRDRVEELLEEVNLDPDVADQYPHELSGGMKQRAAIAMAISCEPDLLIADEPTTALDVVVQAKVLKMLQRLQDKFGFAMVVISHNLATIMKVADTIGVMYAGKLVEHTTAEELYRNPRHPYAAKLFDSIIDPQRPPEKVESIPGTPPDLRSPPNGCRFADRCELATDQCRQTEPPLEQVDHGIDGHEAACFHSDEVTTDE